MNSKWLGMLIRGKDKDVKVAVILNGKISINNIVAVEDETERDIILAIEQQKKE